MSAFNDYCIVCEQMINKDHGEQDLVYCSEECRSRDTNVSLAGSAKERLWPDTSLFAVTPDTVASQYSFGQRAYSDWEGRESYLSDMEMATLATNTGLVSTDTTRWTPRAFTDDCMVGRFGDGRGTCKDPAVSNYQLWLSCRMRQ
ncbi:HER195Cp [Eremothecium sinecaudum]|uniref:HER195Cp n=1 Tax=Eremothecium sinecaudum TaxID=45286 RepID=A0A0X8HU38_9SACH|nr:HER195Cp [Eremothecium sinecaudum]AMD21474.1 HER195Cp [Eremothecium sinecaudum]